MVLMFWVVKVVWLCFVLFSASLLTAHDWVWLRIQKRAAHGDLLVYINTEFRVRLDPFLEEHVPFDKGLSRVICSRMAVFVSRHERVSLITFLLP